MKGLKKMTAVALAAAMATSVTGCADASWIVKSGDTKLPVGVYVADLMESCMYGYMYMGNSYLKSEETVSKVTESAKDYVLDILGYLKRAEEMGLSLTDEEKEEIAADVESAWESSGSIYEANRVSKESIMTINEASALADKVFMAIYGEGGEKEVPEEELHNIYTENYLKAGLMIFTKPAEASVSESATEEEKAQVKATYEASYNEVKSDVDYWMEQAESMMKAGNTFNDVMIAYDFENTPITDNKDIDTGSRYTYIDKRDEGVPAEVIEYLEDAEYNAVELVETEQYWVICCRQDGVSDPADFESLKTSLLYDLKYEEMQADMDAYIEALDVQFNESALKRFAPSKLILGY